METTLKIKNLALEVSKLEHEINRLEDDLVHKKTSLDELKSELRYYQIKEQTNNVNIGDSLFFIDEDDLEIEMMLVSDSKGRLDLVFLTDCSDICESWARGMKMNKRHHHLSFLIEDIEEFEGLKFIGYNK